MKNILTATGTKMMTTQELAEYLAINDPASFDDMGIPMTPYVAMQIATVYACINVIAQSVAQLPLVVYRQLPDGTKELLPKHPLWGVLHDHPNTFQTSYEYREQQTGFTALRGNSFSYIIRVRDEVRELLPINPSNVVGVEQLKNWNVRYKIAQRDGSIRTFKQKDILHLKGLSADGVIGLTPIQAQRQTLQSATAQNSFGTTFFKNAARPSGVLEMPGTLKDGPYDRLKKNWSDNYSGNNLGNVAILEEGMQWKQLTMNADDAQFIESKKFTRSEIASIFRVPPHKIGDLEKATFSNIEQQSIDFVIDTLVPWLKRWEERIKLQLIVEPDVFVEFKVQGLLRGDSKARMNYYKDGIQNGILNPNEARALENMNPREGGDEYIPAANLFGKKGSNSNKEGNDDDDDIKK
jgi:HK97 family phage portal protein